MPTEQDSYYVQFVKIFYIIFFLYFITTSITGIINSIKYEVDRRKYPEKYDDQGNFKMDADDALPENSKNSKDSKKDK